MNLELAMQTFLEESRELLTDMERILLELESRAGDSELGNALFRCVHTVKGSAGMFGLDHVVDFTHVVENVLDRLRDNQVQLDKPLASLLLRCRDHISALVEIPDPADATDLQPLSESLLEELQPYQSLTYNTVEMDAASVASTESIAGLWHLSIRVQPDALQHGMDPISFINYLSTLGELISVTTLTDALPSLDSLDPERCYLGFEIDLKTDASQAELEAVFEFSGDLYQLNFVSPQQRPLGFKALLDALPEEADRLGDLLVASGALTRSTLAACRELQHLDKVLSDDERPVRHRVEQSPPKADLLKVAAETQSPAREQRKKPAQHFRIQAEKLDNLINLVGELVTASAAVSLDAEQSSSASAREAAANLNLLVEQIRDSSLELRMVAIGDTFQRFQRVVRDLSSELGKNIELTISGADTELDKTVVEQITDPLTHLVRNACDHGIETPEARIQSGKPRQGQVRLNAYHESGSIVIEVSDDGKGLNRDRILAKALERSLIKADVQLSDQEVFNLIFEPGFSTVETVTNLSGRGVGMDVVRRNIESLRGMVELVSPGVLGGTTFRIRLPLTLAIIDGFLARVGDATFVVPLETVVECTELSSEYRLQDGAQRYINLRQEVLPLIHLQEHFALNADRALRQNIIVTRHGHQKFGLVVDQLLGEHQTVIKPLSGIFSHLKGLSGTTILGSGQVALILDISALLQQINQQEDAAYRGNPQHARPQLQASH